MSDRYNTTFLTPISHVIFNGPATIVFFWHSEKVIVKRASHALYNPEAALKYAVMKHIYGDLWRKELKKFMSIFYSLVDSTSIDSTVEEAFITYKIKEIYPAYLTMIDRIIDRIEFDWDYEDKICQEIDVDLLDIASVEIKHYMEIIGDGMQNTKQTMDAFHRSLKNHAIK